MTASTGLNPLALSKFALWTAVVAVTTVLLMRRRLSRRARLAVVIGGTLIFGFLYGIMLRSSLNPNPVASLRTMLTGMLVQHKIAPPLVGMLVILLIISWVSNKSLCGNGCQLGLLQDLLYRVPAPKWQPAFKISNTMRVVAFVSLVSSLLIAGLDWIGIIDPFQLFQFKFTWPIALSSGAILLTSLFIRDCFACGACIEACPVEDALGWRK